ncbi:MAG: L-2-hydroxyglutarate oxidase [Candidatus Marinimicrobia bacterium]|nr:L-2-hydroxyglutarate oxidase [Candidatus Neomarinimicrobiota bacterium]|tara:strand:- start:283 stop:1473 length:1191 start_codon:yes stop_codon:yes gene_type:complete
MYDVTIIGGGIIGLATGHALLKKNPSLKVVIMEKESATGQHQTGHNSGVIHSGIYYKPGSLKALNCRRGINLLLEFCNQHSIPYDMCGKLITVTSKNEFKALDLLYEHGQGNSIKGIKKLSADELTDYEPHAKGLSALYCPETGIVDYKQVCVKLSENIQKSSEIVTGAFVGDIVNKPDSITVIADTFECRTRYLINCAGLFSDKVAELAGINRKVRIVPFRGEYYLLRKQARHLVKNLIYPVPDPRYPFLGVHFTRTIDGRIEAGPNAVLAWAREGYKKSDINLSDIWDYLSYSGFWRMAGKYYNTAMDEYYRSFFKGAFVNALQKLVPDIKEDDISHSPAGVRAQALASDGKLVDDFVINNVENMIHVINAPSPAATSSFAIGEHIAKIYLGNL